MEWMCKCCCCVCFVLVFIYVYFSICICSSFNLLRLTECVCDGLTSHDVRNDATGLCYFTGCACTSVVRVCKFSKWIESSVFARVHSHMHWSAAFLYISSNMPFMLDYTIAATDMWFNICLLFSFLVWLPSFTRWAIEPYAVPWHTNKREN